MSEHAIALSGVTKRFGEVLAVDDVSLQVPYGAVYGFLGPNGAGKTTTIRMIMSIFYPDAGRLSVLGSAEPESVKDRLGYLPEEKGLYKKMKTGELLTYYGRLKGMTTGAAKTKAQQMLDRFGLGEWHDKKCDALSKGMGQKVQILGTLIHEPELVILDEPFAGLDPVNVQVVRDLVLEIKRRGTTVIFSTHMMEQAEQICDSIFLINKGRKVLDGPLSEVKAGSGQGIVIDYDGDGSILRRLPGVRRVNDAGKSAEVFMEDGAKPQDLLRILVDRLEIRRFDVREPSLHEIFLRAVGGDDA